MDAGEVGFMREVSTVVLARAPTIPPGGGGEGDPTWNALAQYLSTSVR